MKTFLAAAAATMALAAVSAPAQAQAQTSTLSPPNLADMQCLSIFAFIAGSSADLSEEERGGVVGGVMYYIGRLQGREPNTDWYAEIARYADTAQASDLEANRQRCAGEVTALGQALVDLGRQATPTAQ